MTTQPLTIAVIGRQGSGKGTQAAFLADQYGLTHVSTGDLLRRAARDGGSMADVVRGYLDAGSLVPDALVDGLVAAAISSSPTGCVLDGYPRSTAQLSLLDRRAGLDLAIELRLPPEAAIERLSRRRVCPPCGVVAAAPSSGAQLRCDRCGRAMVRRDDDEPAAVCTRLATYDRVTARVVDACATRGILVSIDAERPRDVVSADVLRAVAPLASATVETGRQLQDAG